MVRGRVEVGDPASAIVSVATAEKPDMLVMGSRGLGDIQGLLMGSVSHKVSHLAPCTVVTVK
jgi:nucleotide-binding universal stress UspA family protein